jgi:hypothetical protein
MGCRDSCDRPVAHPLLNEAQFYRAFALRPQECEGDRKAMSRKPSPISADNKRRGDVGSASSDASRPPSERIRRLPRSLVPPARPKKAAPLSVPRLPEVGVNACAQMILEVPADAFRDGNYSERPQLIGGTDAQQHQQSRRIDGSRGRDDLALGAE